MMDVDVPLIGGIYGLLIIIFGSFVVMNLILAVIIDTFINLHEEEMKNEFKDVDQPIEIIVPDSEFVPEQYIKLREQYDLFEQQQKEVEKQIAFKRNE